MAIDIMALFRHHVYVDRFGGGLGNRVVDLFDDEELKLLIASKKDFRKRISRIIKKQKKEADKYIISELKEMTKLEIIWTKQIFTDLSTTGYVVSDIIDSALNHQLVDVNITPQELYDSAFERKEALATNLNTMVSTGLKESALASSEFLAALTAFERSMKIANNTFAHSIASEMREQTYRQNAEVLRGVIISATLDGRTSKYCMDADGDIYPTGEGPRPPFHPKCRTVAIVLIKGTTDKEAMELLSFRAQVGPGQNYVGGDNTSLRSHKRQVETGMTKVTASGDKRKSSSNYAEFLAADRNTPEGKAFIEDMIGVRKGKRFIREVNSGLNPEKVLEKTLYSIDGRELDIDGYKKRLNK